MKVLVATTPKDGLVGVEVACGICHSRFEIERNDLDDIHLIGKSSSEWGPLSPDVLIGCPVCNSMIKCGELNKLAGNKG